MTRGGRGRQAPGVIAAAVLLPPFGLHLAGAGPRHFWVGTGLTVLGFVPGGVFALYMVLSRHGSAAVRRV